MAHTVTPPTPAQQEPTFVWHCWLGREAEYALRMHFHADAAPFEMIVAGDRWHLHSIGPGRQAWYWHRPNVDGETQFRRGLRG